MKKQRVRINLDVTEDLANRIKSAADAKDIAINAFIRLALEDYFDRAASKKLAPSLYNL